MQMVNTLLLHFTNLLFVVDTNGYADSGTSVETGKFKWGGHAGKNTCWAQAATLSPIIRLVANSDGRGAGHLSVLFESS